MDYQQQEYVMQFLMGLNESYGGIRGQILMLDPLPPVAKVFNLIVQEERQRSIGMGPLNQSSDSMAFNTISSASAPSSAAATTFRGKNRPICSHCGITGHTAEKCYHLHGYPPGFKAKPKAQLQGHPNNSSSHSFHTA